MQFNLISSFVTNFICLCTDTFEKAHKKAERSVKGIESSDLETAQKQSRRSKRLPQPAATDVPSAPLFNLGNNLTCHIQTIVLNN